MQLGEIEWTEQSGEDIAGYEGFRAAAASLAEEDFPQIELLDDGGVFAMRLEEVLPERPEPFETARGDVAAALQAERTEAMLRDEAEQLVVELSEGAELRERRIGRHRRGRPHAGRLHSRNAAGIPSGRLRDGARRRSDRSPAVGWSRSSGWTRSPPAEDGPEAQALRGQSSGTARPGAGTGSLRHLHDGRGPARRTADRPAGGQRGAMRTSSDRCNLTPSLTRSRRLRRRPEPDRLYPPRRRSRHAGVADAEADAGRRKDAFMLESVTGGEVRGRYSIIGMKPDLIWQCHGHSVGG